MTFWPMLPMKIVPSGREVRLSGKTFSPGMRICAGGFALAMTTGSAAARQRAKAGIPLQINRFAEFIVFLEALCCLTRYISQDITKAYTVVRCSIGRIGRLKAMIGKLE